MSELKFLCASIVLLVIAAIASGVNKTCYEDNIVNYTECCHQLDQTPYITNSSRKEQNQDYYLMNIVNCCPNSNSQKLTLQLQCAVRCYLNYSRVIDDDGIIQKNKLIDFLEVYFEDENMRSFSEKCLHEAEFMRTNREKCLLVDQLLIVYIHRDVSTKCASDSSRNCSDSQYFMKLCGISKLRQFYVQSGLIDSDSLESDYDSEYDSSYEDSDSDSSDSDYDYETATITFERTTPLYVEEN